MVFAVREPSDEPELAGLPDLPLGGLPEEDARAVLASVVPGRLDESVRDRIIAETRGNPLALLELPRGMSAGELAGGFALPDAGGVPGHIEDHYRRRLAGLPEQTRRLMLVAAADPVGDATLVWRAAQTLGIEREAAAPAATEQLLDIAAQVRFRHPLVRSAVYRSSSTADRQVTHDALAAATDPEADPDRRAWHRAQATSGPDEGIAAELERSAGRAQARGGLAAAAAFLERSANLTVDPARRVERVLTAVQSNIQAGAFDAALGLLASAESGPLDEFGHARVDLLALSWHSHHDEAMKRHRCCSQPPDGSNDWTLTWRAKRTWTRSPRPCSGAASMTASTCPTWRRLLERRRADPTTSRGLPTCCWTRSARSPSTSTRPCRSAATRCRRSAATRPRPRRACAGCGTPP